MRHAAPSYPRPYNPKLETRNPKFETPKPKPETPNSKPETRNPKPETRNPKPETRNPKPMPRRRWVLSGKTSPTLAGPSEDFFENLGQLGPDEPASG